MHLVCVCVCICNVLHSGLRAEAHHKFEILAKEGGVGAEESAEYVSATAAAAACVRGTEAAAVGVGGGEKVWWVRGLADSADLQVCVGVGMDVGVGVCMDVGVNTHTHTHTWRQAGRDRGRPSRHGVDCKASAAPGIEKGLVPSSSRGGKGLGRERGREGVCVCVCVCVLV
jgi:hypothetical protein